MTSFSLVGGLRKMRVELASTVRYTLMVGAAELCLSDRLGETIRLEFQGRIHCQHCGRVTSKSFNQGHCYPCFKKLAACDLCIVSPDRCHHSLGTCREPDWAADHCFQPHVVYLANSSGLKVGITRATQLPTRWIDQGAVQAVPVLHVASRQQAGLAEAIFKRHVGDRTNWRAMLKGDAPGLDLAAERNRLLSSCSEELTALRTRFSESAIVESAVDPIAIHYPILQYPTKIASLNFEKTPVVEGVLHGIKGQYLMLDGGVINLRKFSAYQVAASWPTAVAASETADTIAPPYILASET